MNIYIFDIFINHCIAVENVIENDQVASYLHYLEVGPLNMPEPFHFKIIKDSIKNISSLEVTTNWWRDFSSWKDYHGLLRTGTSLSMHSVVMEIERKLKLVQDGSCWIDQIDDNGTITIDLHEFFPTILKGYCITAKRKKIRTLEQIAAFNVAECLSSAEDIKQLQIPQSLYKLIIKFLDTYSGDYMSQ